MGKDIELKMACMQLMQAIKNGNKILTNADYDKKWNDYKLYNQKIRNLRRKA